jgi:hypothetical protein
MFKVIPVKQIYFFLLLPFFLVACSGSGGGGGESGDKVYSNLSVSISGLRAVGAEEAKLQLTFPDGSVQEVSEDGTVVYSNEGKEQASNEVGITQHPGGQACLALEGEGSGDTLEITIHCGYRNEIRVSGLVEPLGLDNPLVITRDKLHYESAGTTSVSSFALMSIYENSTAFVTDASGQPSAKTYYSFLYSVGFSGITSLEQEVFILEQPDGYTCYRFAGEQGFNQILCRQDAQAATPSYELAQACVAVKANDSLGYIQSDSPSTVSIGANDLASAEKYYLKPSRLGVFLIYDRDGNYFARDDQNNILRESAPSVRTEWQIFPDKVLSLVDGVPQILDKQVLIPYERSERLHHDLSLAENPVLPIHNDLSFEPAPNTFELVQVDGSECTDFPEASLNATIDPAFYTPKDPAAPIVGYADVHAHYGFPRAIGGMSMSGDIVHPYGIEHALGDCDGVHGAGGGDDLLGSQTGGGSHNTTGYPAFTDWPTRSSITHVQAYYRWIERAYLSGLRLSVTLATGNPSFCQILELMGVAPKRASCSGLSAVNAQSNYIYEIQDYVDAQAGGPGEGWFRIVTSPAEARQVISENKLAVVLGSEHSELFGCRERGRFQNGEIKPCSDAYIDARLQEDYDLGLRFFFPVHRFDNGFAGTMPGPGTQGGWMNLTSHISVSKARDIDDILTIALSLNDIKGHYIEVEECTDPILNGEDNMYSMVDFKNNEMSLVTDVLPGSLSTAVFTQLDPYLDYEGFKSGQGGNGCNIRGLHDPGRYLINQIMDKGLIMDVGHMSIYAQLESLDILEANDYSGVVSSHGWVEGSSSFMNRITDLGGLIGIFNATPSSFAGTFNYHRTNTTQTSFLKSFALGSDIQGVTDQAGVDGNPVININYPFTSYDGLVTFTPPQTGNRVFDLEAEGIAHYGLYAEWLEAYRQVDTDRGDNTLSEFMNSAEAYVQMWERAEAHALAN